MPKIVWEASGHLAGFTDPMVTCTKCKACVNECNYYYFESFVMNEFSINREDQIQLNDQVKKP